MTPSEHGEPQDRRDRLDDEAEALLGEALIDPERVDERVRELVRRRRDLADRVQRQLANLRRLGMLAFARPGLQLPDRMGPFVLGERIGGGGMGVVHEAVEEPHGRRVALKLVRPELLLFDGSRQRFLREVAVIAGLDHPGIVPVLQHGETGGVPYYAMPLVAGRSLADLLAAHQGKDPATLEPGLLGQPGARDWVHACCTIVQQIAEALAHAHGRGVIHRDIKPSNVMVTPDGRALLIDFGLARAAGAEGLTRSGVQPGSLAYMSPEQARGEALDGRTDVWSLGVVTYELLTLRAPFLADTEERIRRLVLEASPPPPRTFHRSLAWEVVTICATAMAPERDRRYASAQALADDLQAFLQARPIAARQASAWLRLRRFAQRRPAVTTMLAAAFLLAGGIPGTFWWREAVATERETGLRQAAESARSAAQQQAEMAQLAERAAVQELDHQRKLSEFLRGILKRANPREATGRVDMTVREALAGAVAEIDNGAAVYPPLVEATIRMAIAEGLVGMGDTGAAAPHLERAWQLRRSALPADAPELAETAHQLGRRCRDLGLLEQAERYQQEAVRIRRVQDPGGPHVAQALASLGITLRVAGRPADAEACYVEAAAIYAARLGADNENVGAMSLSIATLREAAGRFADAEAPATAGLRIYRKLHGDTPHLDLAHALFHVGYVLTETGRGEPGEADLRAALAMTRALVGHGDRQAIAQANVLATYLVRTGRSADAEPLLREAVAGAEGIGFGDAGSVIALTELLLTGGRADEAAAVVRQRLGRAVQPRQEHSLRLLLMRALAAVGSFAEAEPEVERAWAALAAWGGVDAAERAAAARVIAAFYSGWHAVAPTPERAAAAADWSQRASR